MRLSSKGLKKLIYFSFALFLNILLFSQGHAQKLSDFIFEKYSIKNGLSQNSVNCLYQDKLGYIWVGNQGGLDRFDGYHFKQYSHDLKNKLSIGAGFIIDIKDDDKGNIWICTSHGQIAYLNRINDHWENISIYVRDTLLKSNKTLSGQLGTGASISVDDISKSLWIGTKGTGLLNYDIVSKRFKQYLVHPESPIKYGKQENINRVLNLNNSKLLLSTDIGLQYFDKQSHTFSKIFNSTDSIFITQVNDVKIYGDNIYVATKYGAFIYNTITKQSTVFKNDPTNSNTISSDLVRNPFWRNVRLKLFLSRFYKR